MADMQTLMQRNVEFAQRFDQGDLAIRPRLATLVVTCLDARVDPAHILGLQLGDAFVMRNIGGRVTDEIVEQIAILRALTEVFGSGKALEVVVLHHTDCGANRFTDSDVRQRLGEAAKTGEAVIEKLAIADPQVSVAADLDRLRAARSLPDDLLVAGYVYDVSDGHVREVVPHGALRGERE